MTAALRRSAGLALLAPGAARLVAALVAGEAVSASRALPWLAPGLLLVAWAAWLHRPSAPRAAWRLRHDLHLPLLIAAGGAVTIAAAQLPAWRPPLEARLPLLLAAGFLPAMGVAAFFEDGPGTLAAWLTQPLPRWRLVAERVGVLAVPALALSAQALAVSEELPGPEVLPLGLALALGLAPVLAVSLRAGRLAMPVVWMISAALCGAAANGSDLPVTVTPDRVLAASAVLLVAPWLAFARGSRSWPVGGMPELDPRRWWKVAGATPWRTLVRKELRMQLPALGLMLASVPLWLDAVVEGRPERAGEPAILLGLTAALLAGVIPLASEAEYGTITLDLTVLPRALVWRAKLLVSLAVAVLVAVVFPLVLMALGALLAANPGRPLFSQQNLFGLTAWLALVTATWAIGLAASSLARRAMTAFFVALGLIAGVAALLSATFDAGMELGWALHPHAGGQMLPLTGVPRGLADALFVLGPTVTVAVVAVVLAGAAHRRWQRGPERPAALVARGFALAAGGLVGGLALGLW